MYKKCTFNKIGECSILHTLHALRRIIYTSVFAALSAKYNNRPLVTVLIVSPKLRSLTLITLWSVTHIGFMDSGLRYGYYNPFFAIYNK